MALKRHAPPSTSIVVVDAEPFDGGVVSGDASWIDEQAVARTTSTDRATTERVLAQFTTVPLRFLCRTGWLGPMNPEPRKLQPDLIGELVLATRLQTKQRRRPLLQTSPVANDPSRVAKRSVCRLGVTPSCGFSAAGLHRPVITEGLPPSHQFRPGHK